MGLSISIVAGRDKESTSVNASGSIQHVITDKERATFGLNDQQLKSAVKAHFGKIPNDAYLHSPTPWGDLYRSYKWTQVQTVLVAQKAEILGITSQPVIVKTQEFVNNSNLTGTFDVSITESVDNTSTSTWSTGGELTISEKISYGVSFLGQGVTGETSLSYTQSWSVGGQESKSVTVGSSSGVSVPLGPHEGVIAELSASRGVLKVRIHYNAYLIGSTAVNYNPTYKGHHFWALDIANVMAAAGIKNSVESTEDIEVAYYSNSTIELKDKTTGSMMVSYRTTDVAGD